nr:hypothetical protein [Tanacetum cinerariifolium]
MESLSPQVVSAAKLPILNPNEFDLWKMRIVQYFLMTNYSLWEVILNGDSPIPTRVIEGVVQHVALTTAEQKLARKNELKACGTLLMDLPNKNQLKFNIHKDAKTLMEAIKKSVFAASAKVPVFALPNVDTFSDVVIYSFFSSQSNSPQLDNDDLKQIDADDLEEMDLNGLIFVRLQKTVHTTFNVKLSPTKPDKDLSHRPSAPIIEDWVSDSEDESEADPLQNDPSFVQPPEQVKTLKPSVKPVEHSIPAANHKTNILKPKSIETARIERHVLFHYARMTHLNPQRHVVPIAVLTKSKLVPLTTARPVTTVVPRNNVTRPRPAKTVVTKPHSPPSQELVMSRMTTRFW